MVVTTLYRIKCFTEIVKLLIKDYCILPVVVWNIKKLDSAPEPFAQMVYAATVLVKTLLHVSLGDSLYVFSFSQGRSNAEKVEWAAWKGC